MSTTAWHVLPPLESSASHLFFTSSAETKAERALLKGAQRGAVVVLLLLLLRERGVRADEPCPRGRSGAALGQHAGALQGTNEHGLEVGQLQREEVQALTLVRVGTAPAPQEPGEPSGRGASSSGAAAALRCHC